jgi:hypothetical protein
MQWMQSRAATLKLRHATDPNGFRSSVYGRVAICWHTLLWATRERRCAYIPTLRAHARTCGWDKRRLLNAGTALSTTTYAAKDREGHSSPRFRFTRDADRTLRDFYTAHPRRGPDI